MYLKLNVYQILKMAICQTGYIESSLNLFDCVACFVYKKKYQLYTLPCNKLTDKRKAKENI